MQTLVEYVVARLAVGRSRADICEELAALGWTEGSAQSAYREGLIALGAPVPTAAMPATASSKVSTGEVVANIFSFILLHIVIWSTVFLSFGLIDLALVYAGHANDARLMADKIASLNRCIAALAIAFPLYVLVMRHWLRGFHGAEPRTDSRLTTWLTYIVLLIASIMMVSAMISLLYSLLQGTLGVQEALRVAVVFGLSALVFGFYTYERQLVRYREQAPYLARLYFWIAVILLVGAGAGFFAVGVPQIMRDLAFDDSRSMALNKLSGCIEQHAAKHAGLPESLEVIERMNPPQDCPVADPQTGEKYGYRIVSASQQPRGKRTGEFELCANFVFWSGLQTTEGKKSPNWLDHGASRNCKQRQVPLLAE